MEPNSVAKKANTTGKGLLIAIIVLIVAIIAIVTTVILKNNNDIPEANIAQTSGIQEKVAQHMMLPDETAYVATLTDKDAVLDQPFYTNAQNGDRVLLFKKNKKAVIYRESEDKIINVGPILVSDEELDTWNIDADARIE
jgi:hypothetical protein